MASQTFEQAFAKLEKIVAELESADLPLEKTIKRFEEGVRLSRDLAKKLDEAEKRIELLTESPETGEILAEPFHSDDPDGDE